MNEAIRVYTNWKDKAVVVEMPPEYVIDFNLHCLYSRWSSALKLVFFMADAQTGEVIKGRPD